LYETFGDHSINFLKVEIANVCLWAGLGVMAAGALHLCFRDHNFGLVLSDKLSRQEKLFDAPLTYLPFGISLAVAMVLVISLSLPRLIWRGLKSWWLGVTSGLNLISFFLTLGCLSLPWHNGVHRGLFYAGVLLASLFVSWGLFLRGAHAQKKIPEERDVQVSVERKSSLGTDPYDTDEPIENWTEDTLGRASLVDLLTVKLLISKAPVIGFFGEFGSGKTSVLNLLRSHLRGKAIVVSFSTWLPGSEETLTSYLLSDIASQAQREYVVPGLRRSSRRLAYALSESVPLFKGLLRLLPSATQKDDIENLKIALAKLPKRVVVLLDELDRMQKDELLQLLKVVRGIASLPNLSFVCAAVRKQLTYTVFGKDADQDKSNEYFEKFFPSKVTIPKLDDAMLRSAGVDRLARVFQNRDWFVDDEEEKTFREELAEIWRRRIAPWVKNLRELGLLANDLSITAAPLRREVDPIDLILVELFQRFKPDVYEIISRSSVALTGGPSLVRGGEYHSEEGVKVIYQRFNDDLLEACNNNANQLSQVKGILGEMFPVYAKKESLTRELRPKRKKTEESDTRIQNSGVFPVYFRHQLPADIFSSVAMEVLIQKSRDAKSDQERSDLFSREILALEKGSLKRDDFLRKAADEIPRIPKEIGRSWVNGALEHANVLTYDLMSSYGEAGHVLRMIIRVAKKLGRSDRIKFLEDCILRSVDDSLPVRIFTVLPKPEGNLNLEIKYADLYPAFIKRMRSRYGMAADAATVDIANADPNAFTVWGNENGQPYDVVPDPQDRAAQYDFWRRFIGTDRTRLLLVFDTFLLPNAILEMPAEKFVELKMSVLDVRRLAKVLPKSPNPDKNTRRIERKLERFLRGDYAHGIGIGAFDDLYEEGDKSADEGQGQQTNSSASPWAGVGRPPWP
jgi:hypothetical protein